MIFCENIKNFLLNLFSLLCLVKGRFSRFSVSQIMFAKAVVAIRIRSQIRIRMILGLPDPDPLVRGMDPDLDPSFFS
jgi:hypothetical protein